MRGNLAEIVALGLVGIVVASLLLVLGCSGERDGKADEAQFIADKTECLNHVRWLASLLEMTSMSSYPKQGGANLILNLVRKREIGPKDLDILFCPSDPDESLEKAGGAAAYTDLDLAKQGANGRLTSYAGRNMLDAKCVPRRDASDPVVLVADDSDNHHRGRGIVVGMTGGAARWRDKIDDYLLDPDTAVTPGKASAVEELRCLRTD